MMQQHVSKYNSAAELSYLCSNITERLLTEQQLEYATVNQAMQCSTLPADSIQPKMSSNSIYNRQQATYASPVLRH